METRAQARKEKEVMEDPLGLRVEKLENKIAEQNSKMTKYIAEMFEAIHLFSASGPSNQADVHHHFRSAPASASFSPAPEFGKRSGNSNTYAGVTRLAKLDFPRFNGDKIKEWLFQVEQFFEIDHTPDKLKIGLASGHFDDLAATWHQWMVQSVLWKHVMHDWLTYKMLLQGKFKELEVDPIVELTQLQETDGIDEYHGRFELISSRVKLLEENLVSAYLDGLRLDTQTHIKMFQPRSIQQCLLVGRLYELAHPMKSSTSSDAKQLIQQESYVGVKKPLQQHEAICATKSFLEAYSNSELESESPDSKMETNCDAQPQVSISVMESSHQHKLLDDLDMHMVIEDQQPVEADEYVPPTRVIRRTVSVDYQKGVQLFDLSSNAAGTSLSNLVEKKIKKDLVEVDVAKFGDDDQFSDNGEVFGFKIEECETDSGIEQNQLIQEQAEIMEQDWAKHDINTRFEVTSDLDRGKKVLSIAKICSARQLFGKRSQYKERLKLKKKRKGLKSWMFKYKQENERLWRLHNHVFSFPDFCDLRINRLVTTRKRKLLGGLDIVYVKYFVRLVVVGEVQAAMIIGTESDYQKETQISLSNIHVPISLHKNKECSKEKHFIQQVTSIGMDKQQQELNCDRDFGVERDQWCRALYANSETALLNQDRHELCSENKGCLDCFQALVLNSITDSSSRVEEWMKAEPYSVKVNELKMEVQIVDKEMSPSIAVLETRMEEMSGSHAKRAFVFKQTTISYSQCIEHNFFGTMLLRLQSKKNWMFKFKTSSKDYKLQIEIKRWDVNNRVWDPGGSDFQEFERQAEATMTLWFWLNSQMWMRLRFFFLGVKKGSRQLLILEGNVHISTQLLRFKWFSRKVEQPQWS